MAEENSTRAKSPLPGAGADERTPPPGAKGQASGPEETQLIPPQDSDETELLDAPLDESDETELLVQTEDEHTALHPLDRAYLLCIDGPMAGRRFGVRLDVTKIGRAEGYNHVVLENDRKASRRHATIVARGGRYILIDKRSRNRTFVNRHKVAGDEEFALNFGDEIEAGSATLRFVREGQSDWRPPTKSGSFWQRKGSTVLLAASFAAASASAYVGWGAFQYLSVATSKPPALTATLLRSSKSGAAAFDVTSTDHYAPAVVWLPSLRACAIVVIGQDGKPMALDGRDLSTLWIWQGDAADRTQGLAAGDVNEDGSNEVVFSGADGGVAAVNAATGVPLWKSEFLNPRLLSPAIGDVDNDGVADVIVASADGALYRRRSGAAGGRFERIRNPGDDIAAPAILSDVDGDGSVEAVLMGTAGQISMVDANTGSEKVSEEYPSDVVANKTGLIGAPQVFSPPAAASIRGRADKMLVFTAFSDGLTVASVGKPSAVRWAVALLSSLGENLKIAPPSRHPAPVMTDLNGDGQPDVVVGTIYGPLAALSGSSGEVLWRYYDVSKWDAIFATPALYDFDKDGSADVVLADNRGGVHVVSGRSGTALVQVPGDGNVVYAAPLVADVNGDGNVDIVVQSATGDVKVIATNSRTPERRAFWPMDGGTPGRDGTERFVGFATRTKQATLGAGAGVILVLLVLNVAAALVRTAKRRKLERMGAN
jgi:pSer/pThr/pTyr-binding forkhead associated (FHA) protein/outer membrane protein assembly factor BamB